MFSDRKSRNLSPAEIGIAQKVFKNSLPPWNRIFITDRRGPLPWQDNPYADTNNGNFRLNLGPEMFPDATLQKSLPGYGLYQNILVHELTHVWQYNKGYFVVLGSIVENLSDNAYEYDKTRYKPWDQYGIETQGPDHRGLV